MVDFNYVIVGAGTAGCVPASRLSEDPANRVLVLEYGGHDTNPRSRRRCPSRSPATPGPRDGGRLDRRRPHPRRLMSEAVNHVRKRHERSAG